MARIGYAYVGELSDFRNCSVENTPDGMRYCRPLLVRELLRRRHRVYSLQHYQERKLFPNVDYHCHSLSLPNLDVLFVEWRWETYKGFTPDLQRQLELLQKYHGQVPVILFDASYKIMPEDEEKWPKAVIADPGVLPRYLTRKRERLLFWSDFKPIKQLTEDNSLIGHSVYGYIGNDYERRESFNKYYVDSSKRLRAEGIQTALYGNWLKASSERDPRDFFKYAEYESIHFGGRWSFQDSMKFQSKFIATTHIAKKLYYDQGNITVRFFDSLATQTPGLVPVEYFCRDVLGERWVVENPADVVKKVSELSRLSTDERKEIVNEQAQSLLTKFPETHVQSTADFIESKIK